MNVRTDPRALTTGSVLYVNGCNSPISQSTQPLPWDLIGAQSAEGYFGATPDSVQKVRATVNHQLTPTTCTSESQGVAAAVI